MVKPTPRRNWNRDETLLAFELYCHTPFGRLNLSNPEIVALAKFLNRTPSAVGMKACNFASLDPALQRRGIKGLKNRSALEEIVWEEFKADSEAIAIETQEAHERLASMAGTPTKTKIVPTATEALRLVRVRCVQTFFRSAVMVSYDNRCALTGIGIPSLLNASHIIPWSVSATRRADPQNGLCLNVMHDRAFDRGLITFDHNLKLVLSPALQKYQGPPIQNDLFQAYEAKQLQLPSRFKPDEMALAYHRENIFVQG